MRISSSFIMQSCMHKIQVGLHAYCNMCIPFLHYRENTCYMYKNKTMIYRCNVHSMHCCIAHVTKVRCYVVMCYKGVFNIACSLQHSGILQSFKGHTNEDPTYVYVHNIFVNLISSNSHNVQAIFDMYVTSYELYYDTAVYKYFCAPYFSKYKVYTLKLN